MRYELPQQKKLLYEMTVPIRWGDMDVMAHVNNTIYFRFMEIIRLEWVRSLGVTLEAGKEAIVIVNAFCNFKKQLEYPGDVRLKMYASDVGEKAFETWCTMERTDDLGTIYADGGATTLWIDFGKQKSLPLPDWLRKVLE